MDGGHGVLKKPQLQHIFPARKERPTLMLAVDKAPTMPLSQHCREPSLVSPISFGQIAYGVLFPTRQSIVALMVGKKWHRSTHGSGFQNALKPLHLWSKEKIIIVGMKRIVFPFTSSKQFEKQWTIALIIAKRNFSLFAPTASSSNGKITSVIIFYYYLLFIAILVFLLLLFNYKLFF